MNMETEILLRRARALPADQRRELVQELLRSLESGISQAGEVVEPVGTYDPWKGTPASSPHPAAAPKAWASMESFRARLGVPALGSNPILDMREDERF